MPHYLVGLEFTDFEFTGQHARFVGEMVGIRPVPGLTLSVGTFDEDKSSLGAAGFLTTSRTRSEIVFKIPGVSTFFMEGVSFHIPEGLQMRWLTTELRK